MTLYDHVTEPAAVRAFFEASPIEALSVRPEDFVAALENALQTS